MKCVFFQMLFLSPIFVLAQTATPPLSPAQIRQMKLIQGAQVVPNTPGGATPTGVTTTPASAQPQSIAPRLPQAPTQQPIAPQQQIAPQQPVASPQPIAPQPIQQAPVRTTNQALQMPADFEFIAISPYFKNKPKIGKMIATLHAANEEILGTVTGDFGDCKTCIRGASIKGKIGIRVYGQNLQSLTVSRKQSSSIQIANCANNVALVNGTYVCEFSSEQTKLKLNLRIEP